MKVATSPAFLEGVANDPRVFPYIASKGRGKFDLSALWADCIGLEFDTGGLIAHLVAPGVYDLHILFLPKSVNVREKVAQALAYLFASDAALVIGRIPADLPHCRRLARDMGLTYSHDIGLRVVREAGEVPLHEYHLTREAWAKSNGVTNA